jgi:uncharacterized membrane protein
MTTPTTPTTPHHARTRLEPLLARLLTIATTLAGGTIALGLVLSLTKQPHGGGGKVLFVGLAMLALTPIARVLFTLAVFARQREWAYVLACVLVLLLIGGGLWLGVH